MWLLLLCSFAFSGEFDGTYTGAGLTLTLSDDGSGGYAGTANVGGTQARVTAQPSPGGVSGVAFVGGEVVPFVGRNMGTGLLIQTADGSWQVTRNPGSSPKVTPSVGTPAAPLVVTAFATLSTDAADAFAEALLFSMNFAGAAEADKSAVTKTAVRTALAQNFAAMGPEEQVAIANARSIWTDTHSRWAVMTMADRRAFAGAVLTLAFGQQAQAYGGPAGQTSSSAGGSIDIDSLVGPIPGSDCWSSAGCNYDSSTGTYEMEVYEPSYEPSYDPSYD
ncbi:MAG: hypothetical protein AB8H79_06775 [Myxococcota bacterium]